MMGLKMLDGIFIGTEILNKKGSDINYKRNIGDFLNVVSM